MEKKMMATMQPPLLKKGVFGFPVGDVAFDNSSFSIVKPSIIQ